MVWIISLIRVFYRYCLKTGATHTHIHTLIRKNICDFVNSGLFFDTKEKEKWLSREKNYPKWTSSYLLFHSVHVNKLQICLPPSPPKKRRKQQQYTLVCVNLKRVFTHKVIMQQKKHLMETLELMMNVELSLSLPVTFPKRAHPLIFPHSERKKKSNPSVIIWKLYNFIALYITEEFNEIRWAMKMDTNSK